MPTNALELSQSCGEPLIYPSWLSSLSLSTNKSNIHESRTKQIMTSSNGNIFGITGPLWGESYGHRWIPLTKARDMELWWFLWSAPEQTVEQTIETPSRSLRHQCNVIFFPNSYMLLVRSKNKNSWKSYHSTGFQKVVALLQSNFVSTPTNFHHLEAETRWPPFLQITFFKCIFLKENIWISMEISLKLFPRVQLIICHHWFR